MSTAIERVRAGISTISAKHNLADGYLEVRAGVIVASLGTLNVVYDAHAPEISFPPIDAIVAAESIKTATAVTGSETTAVFFKGDTTSSFPSHITPQPEKYLHITGRRVQQDIPAGSYVGRGFAMNGLHVLSSITSGTTPFDIKAGKGAVWQDGLMVFAGRENDDGTVEIAVL